MALDVYFSATPNGWKISIMLEELREAGVELPETRIHMVDLSAGDQFTPEFTAINPNQKMPALLDDGRAVMESCAILQYLGEKYPTSLFPTDERRWDVLPWLYWQAANLGPAFGNKLSYTRYIDIPDEQKAHPLERFGRESLRLVAILGRRFEKHPYICGDDFTVADISVFPWIRAYKWAKVDITTQPAVVDWLKRVRARPGVDRGVAYGVPKDEVDSFSKERRERYKARGAQIAANENLRTSI